MYMFRPIFVFVVGTLALNGCRTDIATHDPITVHIPDRWRVEGVTWTKADSLSAEDRKLLDSYFQANASVADNPAVAGDPIVFVSDRGASRFYWMNSTTQPTLWLCLEFERGRFANLLEGVGNPFPLEP